MPAPTYYYGSPPSAATPTAYPGGSGIFLAVIGPVPLTNTGSSVLNGLALQLGQSKARHRIDDQSLVLFMGRAKPAVEFGQYNFEQFDLTYRWTPGFLFGGLAPEVLLDSYISYQQQGYLMQYQDAKGRGSAQYGITYPALYGVISNVVITDLSGESGWPGGQEVTMTFTEVG